jgi:hypothetical protein
MQVQAAMNITDLGPAHLNGCFYLSKVAAVHHVMLMRICLLFCCRLIVLLHRTRPCRITGTQEGNHPPGWHHETGTGAHWLHYLLKLVSLESLQWQRCRHGMDGEWVTFTFAVGSPVWLVGTVVRKCCASGACLHTHLPP